jgi:hypothetical protein
MLKIENYQLGEYREALHPQGPTQYCMPEKITVHRLNDLNRLDTITGKYTVEKTIYGRHDCGFVIHKALNVLKDWQTRLKIDHQKYGCEYWTRELENHPIKSGHGVGNYTAKHMMEDKGFYPQSYWTTRKQDPDMWAVGSPLPKYMEPYWVTIHALEKMNSWIREYCHWIYNNSDYDMKTKTHIREHLDRALIEIGTQTNTITYQPKVEEVMI